MSFEGTQLKILNLAAAIAETEDYNVAVTLQKLQGTQLKATGLRHNLLVHLQRSRVEHSVTTFLIEIVKDCPPGSEIGIKVRQHIWNYDILHVCSTGM